MILRAVENYAQAWQHYPRADRDWGLVTFLQSANDSPLWGYVPGSYSLANLDFVATTPDRPRPARPNLKSGPLAGSGV